LGRSTELTPYQGKGGENTDNGERDILKRKERAQYKNAKNIGCASKRGTGEKGGNKTD